MKKFSLLLVLLAFSLTVFNCKEKKEEKVLTKKVSFKKEGELQLKKAETDSIVASLDIEIAKNDYEIQTGLMYRQSMAENRGMLFIFEDELRRSFYMKNTEFPLDIIYLNEARKIVDIKKNARPLDETSLPSTQPARYVLEVNAGLSDRWGLEEGDYIEYTTSTN
ncbi:DUF192 domain-containing protein [Luteirhabdus pelagi]|uniref:DUF192 domain-containing protein n=1 Tax=Luteirhabdus pelagi TaxID=2792783 RepID=UPI0019398838|nr:DUF192 domain-containing protein [Luteirhabdus pelagi]